MIAGVGKWEPMSQLWLLPRFLVALQLSSDKVLTFKSFVRQASRHASTDTMVVTTLPTNATNHAFDQL